MSRSLRNWLAFLAIVAASLVLVVDSVDFSAVEELKSRLDRAVQTREYLQAADLKDKVDRTLEDMLNQAIASREYLDAAEIKNYIDGVAGSSSKSQHSSKASSASPSPPAPAKPPASKPRASAPPPPPSDSDLDPSIPRIPLQFSGKIELATKHLPRDNEYPPAWRHIDVHYDWVNKRAWSYIHTSYEMKKGDTGTTYLRRYDQGYEYEIAQFGPEMVCKRSRILNAKMPRPTLLGPNAYNAGITNVRGMEVEHWEEDLGHTVLHFYRRTSDKSPVRLENDDMVYDFLEWHEGEPSFDWEIPQEFQPHQDHCEKVPQDVGFPYVHLLGPYVRF